jgi:uncharacterized damage-inducible protein DinB
MNAQEYFSTLASYNIRATKRLLKACEPLTDEQHRRDVGLFFKSIHGTLNHLLVGDQMTATLTMLGQLCPELDLVAMLQGECE